MGRSVQTLMPDVPLGGVFVGAPALGSGDLIIREGAREFIRLSTYRALPKSEYGPLESAVGPTFGPPWQPSNNISAFAGSNACGAGYGQYHLFADNNTPSAYYSNDGGVTYSVAGGSHASYYSKRMYVFSSGMRYIGATGNTGVSSNHAPTNNTFSSRSVGSGNFSDMDYNPNTGVYCIATTDGIYRSTNGTTFTQVSGTSGISFTDIAYGKCGANHVWVAAYGINDSYYSTDDGATWTQKLDILSANTKALKFVGNQFIAYCPSTSYGIGNSNGTVVPLSYSTDGINWVETGFLLSLGSTGIDPGQFVQMAKEGLGYPVFYIKQHAAFGSTDGISWDRVPHIIPPANASCRTYATDTGIFIYDVGTRYAHSKSATDVYVPPIQTDGIHGNVTRNWQACNYMWMRIK